MANHLYYIKTALKTFCIFPTLRKRSRWTRRRYLNKNDLLLLMCNYVSGEDYIVF